MHYSATGSTLGGAKGISFSFQDVKALAKGRWSEILAALGLPPSSLTPKHSPCPLCAAGRDRFRFDNKEGHGTYFCSVCGAGDGFSLAQKFNGWTAGQALRAVADYLGIKNYGPLEWTPQTAPRMRSREVDTSKVNQSVLKAITALWSASVPVTASDPVDKYLRLTRLLTLDSIPDCLRYQATLDYWIEEQPASWVSLGKLPAMIAEVVDSAGRMVAIHKTYLTNDGQKAAVGEVKKLSRTVYPGAINGAAIKLYAAGETLAVAEGIETALAVRILSLFEFPVWATITANGMERLVVPESVKYLIIAADNDSNGRGQEAACRLAKRYAEKCEVKIITPVQPGCDWADVLENQAENDK